MDGRLVQFNLDMQKSTEQNDFAQIHTVTSAICQSFFDWNKDLADSEELVVFVKTLDKVNEKTVGGNLSIHLSIHPSLYLSIHPLINFLYRWWR